MFDAKEFLGRLKSAAFMANDLRDDVERLEEELKDLSQDFAAHVEKTSAPPDELTIHGIGAPVQVPPFILSED